VHTAYSAGHRLLLFFDEDLAACRYRGTRLTPGHQDYS